MEQQSFLMNLERTVKVCRKLDPELGLQTVHTLLIIAHNPGIGIIELGRKLNSTASSASRNVSLLSNWDRRGKTGMGLVEAKFESFDRRHKSCYLTDKGKQLVKKLAGGWV